ncbi:MAG: DeoR/GlpR family DNA-binding transcription regulator [Tractidigestivibacter sp.]|jgi:DeoR/GlpR family transcriptional regulator of sugar metabolism|uniref:DeoR/GlpR family DNA-binding transcription regulator n=1 Tax=Tractidigestivibacter sp. TaxID=2847320 RepID=UPI003D950393
MFLKERQDKIVEIINAEGRVTVPDLASKFGVTEDCIRKDLKQLDARGALKKVYGGAISVATTPERNVSKRISVNTSEKRVIAEKAYDQIAQGDTIFLDVSTTNLSLAEIIAKGTKQLSIVSNMMEILRVLSTNPALNVLGTGGSVNTELDGFMGSMTLKTLEPMRFDKAFLGALAVDLEEGDVFTYVWDDALIKQLVLHNSARSFLVADAHKFEATGNYAYAKISEFDGVITDKPSAKLRSKIKALGSMVM